jgi:hypothetical protein
MKRVLDDATNMVNFIKQRPVHSRMFKKLYETLDKERINLLFCAEIRWLSRGRVLNGVLEPKGGLQGYFQENSKPDFAKCFYDNELLEN